MRFIFALSMALSGLLFTSQAKAICQLQANPLGALRYDALVNAPTVNLISLTASCDATTNVVIQASRGNGPTYDQRYMGQGLNRLYYNLYLQTNDAYIWGDGSAGTSTTRNQIQPDRPTQFVGNIRIPAHQNPPVGFYSDTLTFTVIF
jgi:spore coat protein U-like protein